ncbi:monooxygenase [Pseudomonas aeruginosa]|uniref:MmoB/DmpM family protein n=1 Tax=Pseudomonas aeruginosa TaxID=287 RepID=UPI000FFF0496|nr:MmoB/DmpM family protein [Pseudomonas aeruginosa]MDI3556143.1 MmoB/DmpM family protein [Pseudomonas aeruginosa]RRS26833.1 monooxygenase [Pseudomonas aeruginosa]RRS29558.1 monooxygenase [Pseudomonas aeruginosa]
MSTVFIALQTNEETRPIIEAIELDNPEAVVNREPAMVKINAPGRLAIRRETIEEQLGRSFDMQELNVNLITLSGNVVEDEDSLTLTWGN